ncbi:MAG TPA: thiamine-phosphate kinase [Xanthomonadales bacterium]|nr:thiamine-phosphate kinase [Xanthomonadales bacterium]
MAGEFQLIDLIARATARRRADVALGIGDDGAVLRVPRGRELVVAVDTLVAGVHFPRDTAPADVGWKSLAVNLSDLAAMGAEPAWATLALTLPEPDAQWVRAFARGFAALAKRHGVALVGGDTTRGPLCVTVQAHGFVPPRRALRRDGARAGDAVFVSGTLGDAAAGLAHPRVAPLRARLDRPTPRVALGLALRGVASAAIDVSDGLAADLGHVLDASGVGAALDVDAMPASNALRGAVADLRALQLGGGDDYELCFTVPAKRVDRVARIARDLRTPLTRIGTIERERGLRDADGRTLARSGYVHFTGSTKR